METSDIGALIERDIQGLDTSTPFLQLSGTIFKGQHDELLGTEILFTEGKGIFDLSCPTREANTRP